MDLTPYNLALIRDSLGQAGSEQGAMFAGGLRLGASGVPAAPGDLHMTGSIRSSTPLGAALAMNVAQSVPDSAWTPAVMDEVRWDTDTCVDLVTNPARFTVFTPGVSLLWARAEWQANPTGMRLVAIRLNGAYQVTKSPTDVTAGQLAHSTCAGLWWADSGDYFELMLYQSSGAPLSLNSNPTNRPEFAMVRIA